MVDVEVEIKEVEARRTEQGFEVKDKKGTFGGGPRDGQVTQGQGTYIWKNWWSKKKECPLLKMTSMNVRIIQTIIFNDKLKIYIILTEQTLVKEECGRGFILKLTSMKYW